MLILVYLIVIFNGPKELRKTLLSIFVSLKKISINRFFWKMSHICRQKYPFSYDCSFAIILIEYILTSNLIKQNWIFHIWFNHKKQHKHKLETSACFAGSSVFWLVFFLFFFYLDRTYHFRKKGKEYKSNNVKRFKRYIYLIPYTWMFLCQVIHTLKIH